MAIFTDLAGKECIFQRHPCAEKCNYWTAARDMLIEATCSCCKWLLPAFLEITISVTVNVNPEKAR